MPPAHRAFIEALERRAPVRPFVERAGRLALTAVFNACVEAVEEFRSVRCDLHLPASSDRCEEPARCRNRGDTIHGVPEETSRRNRAARPEINRECVHLRVGLRPSHVFVGKPWKALTSHCVIFTVAGLWWPAIFKIQGNKVRCAPLQPWRKESRKHSSIEK